MHEILQTLSLAVTSIPSVACVVAANCPKPMAALEVFPTLPSWFQFTESQNTYCTTPVCAEFFRVLATSNALQLIDLSSYGSPPLPPRNHLQLDLEFPEKNAGELFRQMKIWKIMDDFMKHQKKTRKHDCRTAVPQFLPQFLQAQRVFHQPCYCECVEYTGLAPWPAAAVRLRFTCGFFSSRLSDCHK